MITADERQLRVCVLASGRGTDFFSLIKGSHKPGSGYRIALLITNNPQAGAIAKAVEYDIPYKYISRKDFGRREDFLASFLAILQEYNVEFIALAGYLRKIPPEVIREFPRRIINIHPALLPSFGGKGMYGEAVHKAVLEAGCRVSGVTVHIVDEEYDRGGIVAQRAVPVEEDDTPDTLAKRVLEEEHQLYPQIVSWFANGRVKFVGDRIKILTGD